MKSPVNWRRNFRDGSDLDHQQMVEGSLHFFLDFGSSCDSLMAFSKNAESFPMMSRASSVFFRFPSLTSNWRRRRAISACSALSLPIRAPAVFPSRTPASRSLRHSVICEE